MGILRECVLDFIGFSSKHFPVEMGSELSRSRAPVVIDGTFVVRILMRHGHQEKAAFLYHFFYVSYHIAQFF